MTQAFNLSQLANKVNTSGQLDASTGLVNTTPAQNGGTGKSTNTSGALLLGAGTSALTELAGAATNDVVAWNGTAWASAPGNSVAGGDYIMRTYVSPATYVKPTNVKAIKVTVVGSGGNGGAASGAGSFPTGNGGGGGGGGAAIRYLDSPAVPASPIAITAGTGTNSFAAFASATSGSAGGVGTPGGANGAGGAGGAGSSGTLNFIGNPGYPGFAFGGLSGSNGSSAIFSAVLIGVGSLTAGRTNTIYGGGGTGAGAANTTTPIAGGTGAPGIVIVEEFY